MVHLRTTRQVPIELVRQILSDGGVQLAEGGRTGLRRLQGKPLANVSRLRIDPSGRGLHFFVGMDNVRGAAACAVASAGALLRDVIAERK